MSEKYQWFNGLKYTRDDKTGYYLNATHLQRMHRAVWEFYNGEIPKGYAIHHIDHDKSNNDISNLKTLPNKKHLSLHGIEIDKEDHKMMIGRMNHARIYASKWHGTEEGKNWHKEHYEQMKDTLHKKDQYVCYYCGQKFVSVKNGHTRFCSNKCKSAWRRMSGVDNETRICKQCGKEFTVNKYAKQECCSMACSNRLHPRLPQLRKNKKD